MAALSLTAVLTPVENGWTQAHLNDVPGVITCAPTRAQALEDLVDALEQFLRSHTVGDPADPAHGERIELRLVLAG
jgi:predicted RNase H-like HicB family nuclease